MSVIDTRAGQPLPWMVGMVIGVALILLGQFTLDGLADSSDAWHWIQHGVFVIGGGLLGVGGLKLYGYGQRSA